MTSNKTPSAEKETPVSIWPNVPEWLATYLSWATAGTMTLICILWTIDFPYYLGLAFYKEQFLALVLGLGIATVFIEKRWNGRKGGPLPWYDALCALLGLATLVYASLHYERLLKSVAFRPIELTIIGSVVVVLVMEGLRRATGWVLFSLIGVFLVYAPLCHRIPGALMGRRVVLSHLIQYIGFDPSAVFGTPLNIAATIVILFILMGKLLFKAGGGSFFTDLAQASTGRTRGGSAKIAVIASALFGSISGSAVSNVASTGVITIPLMRKTGYSPVQAGAIEAVASTGGQLMPPIMGAAAFLMAEFLEIPYTKVIVAATFPAIFYYLATFIQVDLLAARNEIHNVDAELPQIKAVLRTGWHFILPIAVLLIALFWLNVEPEEAALYSSVVIALAGLVVIYKGRRLTFSAIAATLWETGLSTVELVLIVAAAGFVIGILNITGLGFALTLFLVDLAGSQLWILLLISAAVSILLGMGMPTSGVYVLLAALVAPAIVEAGVDPLPAHMFILYFGMMSMITPPIALAAFAAAAITRASAMATGYTAMRIGWIAYLIPFLLIYSPTLMLSGPPLLIVIDLISVACGIFFITIAIVGYFKRQIEIPVRTGIVILGLMAMLPRGGINAVGLINAVGIGIGLFYVLREILLSRRA